MRRSVAANLAGRLWAALMSFAFVPFYIRYLGMEAFGLIGFFTALLAVFAVLDLGLGLTVNRELARMSAVEGSRADARTLLRTLEAVYWAVALLIGAITAALAPLIASRWLRTQSLAPGDVRAAVELMGAVAVFRWPVALYTGALQGLRRQVSLNAIAAASATLAGGGAVLVLRFAAADIRVFFAWQVAATLVQVALLRRAAWRALPLDRHRPAVALRTLGTALGFSAGVAAITLLSIVLTQLDKAILSRLLPLREFGYYALAGNIATVLAIAGATVESATFPALARLHAAGDAEGLRRLYHLASQGLSLLVIPLAVTLSLFAPELLRAYVGDPVVVDRTHLLLSLVAIGNALLALMYLPLSLQLASGWTSLSIYKNILAVAAFVPALLFMVSRFGALGAALVWIGLTLSYVVVEVQVMHRRLLPGEQWRWYSQDLGVPAGCALAILGALRLALPAALPLPLQLASIAAAGVITLVVAGLMMPAIRGRLSL